MSKLIGTTDGDGAPNGWLLPLWHVDSGEPVDQVYLTAVYPGMAKGPHLHMKRTGRFTCVKGDVLIVTRVDDEYREHWSGQGYSFATVRVPPGVPAAIYCLGRMPAFVLNMPSPPWRVDDQDDHEVIDWRYSL